MVSARMLDVYLDGTQCGQLEQTSAGNLSFTYLDSYRLLPDATPLSLSMPLSVATHRKRVVLPWLQGLLPDSENALSGIARRFGVSANNPFAILEHSGADTAGAVQIVPIGSFASDTGTRSRVNQLDLDEVAALLSAVVNEYQQGSSLGPVAGNFSLAGAQPKIALHRLDDDAWGVPQDATPTTHILKPAMGTFSRLDVVEQLSMRAAAILGNQVAETELAKIGDWDVLVSKRYDRRQVDGRWRRLHQEDFCQALSVSPAKKYQHRDGGPGVAAAVRLLQSLPIASDRLQAGRQFFRALVFNVVGGCTDAHGKNYSLLLDGRSARLAPLYDLLSYAPYWDRISRIDSAMSIGGEYSLRKITPTALIKVGVQLGLPYEEASEIVEDTRQSIYSAFAQARDAVVGQHRAATKIADALLTGLAELPLVAR